MGGGGLYAYMQQGSLDGCKAFQCVSCIRTDGLFALKKPLFGTASNTALISFGKPKIISHIQRSDHVLCTFLLDVATNKKIASHRNTQDEGKSVRVLKLNDLQVTFVYNQHLC